AGKVRGEERDDRPLREHDPGLLGPAQELLQRGLALERRAEREEVRRKEEREPDSREPMDEERPVGGLVAIRLHGSTTAATARSPITVSARPISIIATCAAPLRGPSHSAATVRSPIAPWIAAASTNTT